MQKNDCVRLTDSFFAYEGRTGVTAIFLGDGQIIGGETILRILEKHLANNVSCTILRGQISEPRQYCHFRNAFVTSKNSLRPAADQR